MRLIDDILIIICILVIPMKLLELFGVDEGIYKAMLERRC